MQESVCVCVCACLYHFTAQGVTQYSQPFNFFHLALFDAPSLFLHLGLGLLMALRPPRQSSIQALSPRPGTLQCTAPLLRRPPTNAHNASLPERYLPPESKGASSDSENAPKRTSRKWPWKMMCVPRWLFTCTGRPFEMRRKTRKMNDGGR